MYHTGTKLTLLTSSKFRTNFARSIVLGPHPKSSPRAALVDLPNQKRSGRLFFEHGPLGVRNLAFETPEPAPASSPLILPRSLSPHPKATFFESYFYSTADLEGIERIVPCQRNILGRQHIIGLCLDFPEGRRSCVGQVRLDSLGNSVQLGAHHSVWLGFSKEDHRPFVSALELSEPEPGESVSWLEIPPCGRLEWWFSVKQCQVYCGGKSSPNTRL